MGWMQKLYETYEKCSGNDSIHDSEDLFPIGYSAQNAHIEVVIDGNGNFRRAKLIQKENTPKTLIPVTESSSGRTSGEDPHPLCDSIQYCAADYPAYGGIRKSYFESYFKLLKNWSQSTNSHPKVKSVLTYIQQKILAKDLIREGLLSATDGRLDVIRKDDRLSIEPFPVFKLLTFDDKGIKDQAKVFIRWVVETEGEIISETWKDKSLQDAWRKYLESLDAKPGFCYVSGVATSIAVKHPAKLRNGKDGAKLISSNDTSGYTFLGRFTDSEQVVSVSSEITQKAHSALRWLIGRKQAHRNGDQVFVSWIVSSNEIPVPWLNSMDLLGDVGQGFSTRLNQAIAGYRAQIGDTEDVQIMGIDSAVPGRMAITYYQELKSSDFFQRILCWHESLAWPQKYGKDFVFVGAPAPRDIAEVAYGRRLDDKLKKTTVERLIPCIIEGLAIPRDILNSVVRRTFNRVGLEEWEWEKCLGVACSLFKGFHKERRYSMALEEDRNSRDYLYGRLLAAAEHVEARALYIAGEKNRETMASRLMQRFADRPYTTWRTIELSLNPYKARLRSNRGAFLFEMDKLTDHLISNFSTTDGKEAFINDRPLSGEFLLGYHCQRQLLKNGGNSEEAESQGN